MSHTSHHRPASPTGGSQAAMESLPLQGTDPSCVPGGSAGDISCDGSTSTGNWGHFPAGPFPVPQNPPPFPLLCQAQLQDSWLTMEIAAMKEQGGSCQGAKALGTDSWSFSSLVHPSIHYCREGACGPGPYRVGRGRCLC